MEISIIVLNFVISMIVSTLVIFAVTKLLTEKRKESKGFGSAIVAAFAGAIVYTLAYYFLGTGLLAAGIGGIVWLAVLGSIYKIGWLKSLLIAIVIWIIVSIVSFLPTVVGPL